MTFDAKFWRPFPRQNNLSWNCPNGRLLHKKLSACYLLIEMKCILVRFPMYVTGSSLAEVVKIKNTRISIEIMWTEDLIVR